MKNATYLFEKPTRFMKNSESRWTAVAQMSLIYISANQPPTKLPVYNSDKQGVLTKSGCFPILGFTSSNTVCECGLRREVFKMDDFEDRFFSIKPDIFFLDLANRRVVLIEVKTLGESVARNIDLYSELQEYLIGRGWNCNLYYLLSHGHEKPQDWRRLAEKKSEIIFWEDLFEIMSKSPIAGLIGEDLSNYCARPEPG